MPGAPSWSSAERTRAGSFSPVATITSAPAVSARRSRRAARRARRRRSAGSRRRRATSWESSGRRAAESKTTRRGWRGSRRPSTRAVSCGSSASAVPMPTTTASHSRAPAVRELAAVLAARSTSSRRSRVATLPSSVIADLNSTHGRPVRACLRNAWLSSRARGGQLAVGDDDLDALVAQDAQAAAGRPSRSGRRRRRRRARCPASRIASVHGGVLPSWQHGSSET